MTQRWNFFFLTCLLLALAFTAPRACAYAIQDRHEVVDIGRGWRVEPSQVASFVQVSDERSGKIYFQNLSKEERTFAFRVQGYQRGIQNPDVKLMPGETTALPVEFSRVDQRIGVSALKFAAAGEKVPDVPEPSGPVVPDKACFALVYQDDLQFNPRIIAYFIKRSGPTAAEIHFKNFAPQPVHFDFRILGYQGPLPDNPRITAPPNEDVEVLIEMPTADDGLVLGAVEIYNVRLNEDAGAQFAVRKEPFRPRRMFKERGWTEVSLQDDETADFNLAALVFRPVHDGTTIRAIEFKNLGTLPVHFDFYLDRQAVTNNGNPRVHVDARTNVTVQVQPIQALALERLIAFLKDVRMGPDSGAFVIARPAAAPKVRKEWLHPVPFSESPLFDPLMLGYLITPAADGKSLSVTFKSSVATSVSFDFEVMGFPSADGARPRMSLLPGQESTVTVPAAKAGARAALAKITVSNLRAGGDHRAPIMTRN